MTTTTTETPFEIEAPYVTPGEKLVLAATAPGGLKARKYVVAGYPYYVVTVSRSEWTFIRGEPFKTPTLHLNVEKRTKSKETAMREFRLRGRPGTFVLWKSSTGEGYKIVARGRDIVPPSE